MPDTVTEFGAAANGNTKTSPRTGSSGNLFWEANAPPKDGMILCGLAVQPADGLGLTHRERYLLQHRESMTRRMERYYGQRMSIELIDATIADDDVYEREIVMRGAVDGAAKQVAHLKVYLRHVHSVRDAVVNARVPFGRLLATSGIGMMPCAIRLWRFESTAVVQRLLETTRRHHHGRTYRLMGVDDTLIAEVLEIVR